MAFCALGVIGLVNSTINRPESTQEPAPEPEAAASNEASIKDDMLRNLDERKPSPAITSNIPPPESKPAPAPKPDTKPKVNPIEGRVSSGWFREDTADANR